MTAVTFLISGAGEGNRTLATSLEGWGSTIELHPHKKMVGAAGFEPATPWSQARCATKLRYTSRVINVVDHQGLEPRTYRL